MGILSMLFRIGADTTDFEIGAKRVQSLGDKMAKTFKRDVASAFAGVFVADRLVDFGLQAIRVSGQISDLSKQLGVSAEFLQEIKFAAELSGSSLDSFSSSIEKIQIARTKALGGNDELVKAFESLGVSSEQLKSSRIEDIFIQIGKAFEDEANPEKLLEAFIQLAGRGGGALIPAMVSGLSDAADQAHRLGLIMSQEVVNSMDEANDRLDILKAKATAGIGTIVGGLIEPVLNGIEHVYSAIEGFLLASSTPEGGKELSGMAMVKHMAQQAVQSFRASWDSTDIEEQNRKDIQSRMDSARNAAKSFDFEATDAELKKARQIQASVNTAFMGAQGDSLARIGGFTGFQTTQQQVINTLKIQVDKLDRIVNNTDQTARSLKGE